LAALSWRFDFGELERHCERFSAKQSLKTYSVLPQGLLRQKAPRNDILLLNRKAAAMIRCFFIFGLIF
jgi:hypothetical protein